MPGAEAADVAPRTPWGLVLLGSYASAVTIALLWLWWGGGGRDAIGSPSPSEGGDRFARGLRREASARIEPPPPIPEDHRTRLGEPIRLGALELTPLSVHRGPLTLEHVGYDSARQTRAEGEEALILRVRLRNVSADEVFAPLDEAFLRERDSGQADSYIEAGGGSRIYLAPLAVESEWSVVGQEFPTLRPGEQAETILVSDAEAFGQATDRMTWRIRLRTGVDETDVVGVMFGKDDIR